MNNESTLYTSTFFEPPWWNMPLSGFVDGVLSVHPSTLPKHASAPVGRTCLVMSVSASNYDLLCGLSLTLLRRSESFVIIVPTQTQP